MSDMEKYDAFIKRLEEIYPRAMRNVYCGISINEGWYHIVTLLVHQMQSHVSWKRRQRARDLRLNRAIKKGQEEVLKVITQKGKQPTEWEMERADEYMEAGEFIPTEYVPHIEIHQIKEKFGGLRFYFEGGDDFCRGLETMAETWANRTCEVCGETGKQRGGGWIRTLCDTHEAEYNARKK
mgnify:FL=1